MMLCARNETEIKLFISRGHSINYQDSLGTSALHKAVLSGKTQLVKDLLENGADPNLKNYLGQTPLFYVQDTECIDILFKYGHSDIFNVCNNNKNAISINTLVKKYIDKLATF